MAYHFSTSLPRLPTHSVLLPRSRLSACGTSPGQIVERPGLLEFLRELAFEKSLPIDARFHGPALRVGLAATPWQLQQSLDLLMRLDVPNPLNAPARADTTDANLDRVVALAMNMSLNTPYTGALATIWLRRDGASGLPQDAVPSAQHALAQMREAGKRLVAVEAIAFDPQAPLKIVLEPMMHALRSIVVDLWDATDIITTCPASQVGYYCSKLGFSRLTKPRLDTLQTARTAPVMLHMPTQRMASIIAKSAAPRAEALSA
ncbi:hypothetical protein VVD49_21505 [Uliginosibacterium sp. H3]|uniref:N-acyl amino acid synthase FeeM catalytic core domain-containing protein n=1 Tax=Uliginosibacterium silvisoli TaxID=3114758 RepID=A0ABU6K9L7_9RHOO|nr:hypothetical protein [Uliginosibacterium sp. H3]